MQLQQASRIGTDLSAAVRVLPFGSSPTNCVVFEASPLAVCCCTLLLVLLSMIAAAGVYRGSSPCFVVRVVVVPSSAAHSGVRMVCLYLLPGIALRVSQ